jgi:hypothetical protein
MAWGAVYLNGEVGMYSSVAGTARVFGEELWGADMSDGLSREKELSVVLEEPVLSASEVTENLEVIDDRVAPSGAACAVCALAVPTSALAADPNPTVACTIVASGCLLRHVHRELHVKLHVFL